MKAVTKLVFLDENDEKFFGEGPCRLLRAVEETGSLNAAAASMEMAYTKALKMLKNAERALGFPLTMRAIGGKNGGGSKLTPEGLRWLEKYEKYRDACVQANAALYRRCFPRIGCVIMASGMGKRFGGNKLMADFCGEPMIAGVLRATEGLFADRIVVTRHGDAAEYCRERGARVLLHQLPHRSDTVRLGLEAMQDLDGCMFCQADQPLLRRETLSALLCAWEEEPALIHRTEHGGVPASPVIFPAADFPELLHLPEGQGGGCLLKKYPERVKCMHVADEFELMDADNPAELNRLREAVSERNYAEKD